METRKLQARFTDFELPPSIESRGATVAFSISKGMQQKIFFMNLASGKGVIVEYPKRGGLLTIDGCAFLYHFCTFIANREHKFFPRLRTLFQRYHNGLSFLEILFKLSKPHGITYIGEQKYLVSLWSSSNYFVIDLQKRDIEVQTLYKSDQPQGIAKKISTALAVKEKQEIFSTYQYFDNKRKETYFATHLRERGKEGASYDIPSKIQKYSWNTKKLSEVWKGDFGEADHYIALNKDKSYLGLVQFGDFFDDRNKLLPSKILILDLKANKEWRIDNTGWSPSAHIDWDPIEPDVCYLSCHNGVITPVDNQLKFFFQKIYKWNIFGPASVHKYKITDDGPKKLGIFTHPDMFRMTIHKVFVHGGKKILACTGFPDNVFISDAHSLKLIRRVSIKERSGKDSVVGSLFPSPDGEKIFVITTRSFQIIDVESGNVDSIYDVGRRYDPFNHMASVSDTDW